MSGYYPRECDDDSIETISDSAFAYLRKKNSSQVYNNGNVPSMPVEQLYKSYFTSEGLTSNNPLQDASSILWGKNKTTIY